MNSRVSFALLFFCLLPAVRAQPASAMVRVFAQEKPVVVPDTEQEQLRRETIDLLKSSNFHSDPGDKYHIFTFAGVQQDYRDAIASGDYLLMILSTAQVISTQGGDVTAAEIVIGLRGPGGKNAVFTIDETGRIVSHAKYSGPIFLELKRTIGQPHP